MNKSFLKKKLKIIQKLILNINIILFSLNTGFYGLIKIINIKPKIFKFSDYFIMNLNIKSYKDIIKYLADKFRSNFGISKNHIFKKEIKIKSTGLFDRSYHINWLKKRLGDEFILEFVEEDPDYLIYNCFANDDIYYKYNNSIKIAIFTENYMPDLNFADYLFR